MKPTALWVISAIALVVSASAAIACPFCTAETQTLTEEIGSADVAVLARLIEAGPAFDAAADADQPIDAEMGKAKFAVVEVLRGVEHAEGVEELEAIFFGEADRDTLFLIRGVLNATGAGDPLDWSIPFEVTPEAAEYIKKLQLLPESGPERLAFFLEHLQHEDPMLSQDAYEEFARAPYDDLKAIKDRLDVPQLWEWIDSPSTSPSRRRLFFTLLGVCGGPADVPRLEAMMLSDSRVVLPAADATIVANIASGGPLASVLVREVAAGEERRKKAGLDAMTACYLTLRGADGLDLIDRRFLADAGADYSHVYSVLMALRFLADEPGAIPLDRITRSARLLLAHIDFADQVIPDLARWEDWGSLETLVALYRNSFGENTNRYVREPIVTYLDVASEQPGEVGQRAAEALAELKPLDPETFDRARRLSPFGFMGSARARAEATSKPDPAESTFAPPSLDELIDGPIEGPIDGPTGGLAEDAAPSLTEADAIPDPAGGVEPTYADAPPELQGELTSAEREEPVGEEGPSPAATARPAEPPAPAIQAPSAPQPPSRIVLFAAPLLAGGVLLGIFSLLLRGGV